MFVGLFFKSLTVPPEDAELGAVVEDEEDDAGCWCDWFRGEVKEMIEASAWEDAPAEAIRVQPRSSKVGSREVEEDIPGVLGWKCTVVWDGT